MRSGGSSVGKKESRFLSPTGMDATAAALQQVRLSDS